MRRVDTRFTAVPEAWYACSMVDLAAGRYPWHGWKTREISVWILAGGRTFFGHPHGPYGFLELRIVKDLHSFKEKSVHYRSLAGHEKTSAMSQKVTV